MHRCLQSVCAAAGVFASIAVAGCEAEGIEKSRDEALRHCSNLAAKLLEYRRPAIPAKCVGTLPDNSIEALQCRWADEDSKRAEVTLILGHLADESSGRRFQFRWDAAKIETQGTKVSRSPIICAGDAVEREVKMLSIAGDRREGGVRRAY